MKSLTQTIQINKPIGQVFTFTLNPENTPKWVEPIVTEQTNEWPVKLGTIYRNQRKNGEWSEYEVTAFDPGKTFVMSQRNDSFHVGYAFTPVDNGAATELKYRIWKDEGELPVSLTIDTLQGILDKLKQVVEAQ